MELTHSRYLVLSSKPHQMGTPETVESVTVLPHPQGYIASRVLSRRACYIIKMDHKAIPALDKLQRFLYEKQVIWGSSANSAN